MPKVRRVSERRANKAVATVNSAQPATMVLPSLADNPSQMAPQGSPAPVEAPGNVVLPIPSVHDTLGVNVSYSNREKIINGQYLDLGCLLETQTRELNDRAIILVNGELCARERSSPKISTIEQWTDAFILFLNIYVGAHPDKIHQLLKYLHSIRLGASRISGQGWKVSDEQFRLKKASNPASSWGEMDTELWLLYMLPSQSTPVSQASKFGPEGRCYDFNFRGSCEMILRCNMWGKTTTPLH